MKEVRQKPCTMQVINFRFSRHDSLEFWSIQSRYKVWVRKKCARSASMMDSWVLQFHFSPDGNMSQMNMYSLNIVHSKFVDKLYLGQSDSVTQNKFRERLVFFFHFTGSSIANDHHTASDDRCNNIDLRPCWRLVFGKFICPSPKFMKPSYLRFLLQFFLKRIFSIIVFLLSFLKEYSKKYPLCNSGYYFIFSIFEEPHFPRFVVRSFFIYRWEISTNLGKRKMTSIVHFVQCNKHSFPWMLGTFSAYSRHVTGGRDTPGYSLYSYWESEQSKTS